MKKVTFLAVAIAAMLTFTSCASVEDKAKSYAKDISEAIADGDFEKAAELSAEFEKWADGLSEEDQLKVAGAVVGLLD